MKTFLRTTSLEQNRMELSPLMVCTIPKPHANRLYVSARDASAAADSIIPAKSKIPKIKFSQTDARTIFDFLGFVWKPPNPKIQNLLWHLRENNGFWEFWILQEWCLLVEQCHFGGNIGLL